MKNDKVKVNSPSSKGSSKFTITEVFGDQLIHHWMRSKLNDYLWERYGLSVTVDLLMQKPKEEPPSDPDN